VIRFVETEAGVGSWKRSRCLANSIDSRWKKETDFLRMMKIVVAAGYNGYVGIEYEGQCLPERAGIQKSKELLDRVHAKLG